MEIFLKFVALCWKYVTQFVKKVLEQEKEILRSISKVGWSLTKLNLILPLSPGIPQRKKKFFWSSFVSKLREEERQSSMVYFSTKKSVSYNNVVYKTTCALFFILTLSAPN